MNADLFFALTVNGDPRAKGRPRSTKGGGVYTPAPTRKAEADVRKQARAEMRGRQPTGNLVLVELVFHAGTARRVDIDNLAKLTLDAINTVVFADDSQIVDLHVRKTIDRAKPRTVVRVYEIPAAQQEIPAA